MTQRLGRRYFPPLSHAPKVQGRAAEIRRLLIRASGWGTDRLSDHANDWLMRTMTLECHRASVTAVHAYEDCSLWQFAEAKRLGKACIYDLPIGYFPVWERTQVELAKKYSDWLPAVLPSQPDRREQKRKEIELADLLLVPSGFVANTVREFHPYQAVAVAPYGVDLVGWRPEPHAPRNVITFLFAGQCSLRKGIPLLVQAWRAAGLRDARLLLVGPWQLAECKKKQLPQGCQWIGPTSSQLLLSYYHEADVFVFPTNFEGRALVVGEAMASGLPMLTTYASGADDMVDQACGRIVQPDNLDELVESLRWFDKNRHLMPEFGRVARRNAERCSWERYRCRVTEAVAPLV